VVPERAVAGRAPTVDLDTFLVIQCSGDERDEIVRGAVAVGPDALHRRMLPGVADVVVDRVVDGLAGQVVAVGD
jgi:hypothetical protein